MDVRVLGVLAAGGLGFWAWNRQRARDRPQERLLDGCVCASFDGHARAWHVMELVRPDQVEHLVDSRYFGQAEYVAAWLQHSLALGSLAYQSDPRDCDLWCPPSTTLRNGGGDCDDLAILALSMLRACRVEAHAVSGYVDGSGHMWVEGRDWLGGFLLEATTGELMRHRPASYRVEQHFV